MTNTLLQANSAGLDQAAANTLSGNANFNAVAAVLILIFLGVVVYLIRLDRKLTKLEKELKK